MYKSLTKIAITGGPCAGKTKGLARIYRELTEKGYVVYLVAEAATIALNSGVIIEEENISGKIFELLLLEMQQNNEKTYEKAASFMRGKDVVIICDRGIIDGKAYVSQEEFLEICEYLGRSETEIRDSYDAVFHLKTAADGAEKFYTNENNEVRSESPEEARQKDARTLAAWIGHPHLRVIDNSTDFEKKIDRLMIEIYSFLGLPVPIEIERKYLIRMPDLKTIFEEVSVTEIDIFQTYLKSAKGEEKRIRQRGIKGNYSYFLTTKKDFDEVSRIELEEKLEKDEYLQYLMEVDDTCHAIRKKRYCFVYQNQYFELDIYPFWDDKAILEIELTDKNQEVKLPHFISVIEDVTEKEEYKNRSLAKRNLND